MEHDLRIFQNDHMINVTNLLNLLNNAESEIFLVSCIFLHILINSFKILALGLFTGINGENPIF